MVGHNSHFFLMKKLLAFRAREKWADLYEAVLFLKEMDETAHLPPEILMTETCQGCPWSALSDKTRRPLK